jgi:hypothetical protein
MDYLVLGNCLIDKTSGSGVFQTAAPETTAIWKSPFLGEELQKLDCSIAALRRFAFTIAAVLVSLGGIILWRRRAFGWPLLSLAFLLLATVLLKPKSLRFVYRSWMMLALLLGSIASRILLTFAFFLILTPIGLLQRLFGKRPLDLRFKSDATTYWQARSGHPASADYQKQF